MYFKIIFFVWFCIIKTFLVRFQKVVSQNILSYNISKIVTFTFQNFQFINKNFQKINSIKVEYNKQTMFFLNFNRILESFVAIKEQLV